jgi:hypothetical protein
MFILIHDQEKDKLIEFRSKKKFKLKTAQQLLSDKSEVQGSHEVFTSKDYWSFVPKE